VFWRTVTGSRWCALSAEAETRPWDVLLIAGSFLVVLAWAWRPIWDIDLFWHVVVGRLILEGGVPSTDVLSAADPTAPWTTFQWGYEVLVAAVEATLGLPGLKAMHAVLVAGTFGLLAGLLRKTGASRALCLGILGFALLMVEDRIRARPHLFELLFVVGLAPLLYGRERQATPIVLVLVMGLWANLHAVSSLWWVALVGAWTLSFKSKPSAKRFGTLAAGIVVALASPPVRKGLMGALLSHSDWPAELVPELQPTWAYWELGFFGWAMLAGVVLGLAAALHFTSAKDQERGAKIAALGCALAAVLMARWAWLAVVPMGLWMLWQRPAWGWGVGAVSAAVVLGHVGPRWTLDDRLQTLEEGSFPVQACQVMQDQDFRVPLDTTPAWSGYLLYCLYPKARVLSDGRLVFGPQITELLLAREAGDLGTFDQAVGIYGTQALVWPAGNPPPLDESRWRIVHSDPVAQVWLPRPVWAQWE
jgi:hypothetical protein